MGYLNLSLESEEMNIAIQLLQTTKNHRTLKLGLCFLVLCPNIFEQVGKTEILNILIQAKEKAQNNQNDEFESDSEMLLLLAIHFHTNQSNSKINELFVNALSIQVRITDSNFMDFGKLFTRELFQEKLLAEFVISLPPTKNLGIKSHSLAVTCLHELLKGGIYDLSGLDIKPWLLRQLFETSDTIHPLIPSLIAEYVRCLLNESNSNKISRISDSELINAFDTSKNYSSDLKTFQILLAYYVLSFHYQLYIKKTRGQSNISGSKLFLLLFWKD